MKLLDTKNYCYGEKKTSCTCFGTSNVARLAYFCVCKLQNILKTYDLQRQGLPIENF